MKRKFQPGDYADSDSRYMTSLLVFGENKPCLELEAKRIDPDHKKDIQDKISAALKLLTFRESRVIVQFWWPREDGNRQLLTTLDQPFILGVTDERLSSYRRDSERYSFIVVKDHEEEDHSPAARVLRHELPEWTFDINSYTSIQFPQQACAIRCGLQGYLGLPVFDSTTRLCVGVVEILMSSMYTSFADEVQLLHKALKTQNLTSPQGFEFPPLHVPNERKQNDIDTIHGILKLVCNSHNLPLAQTWTVSQHSSSVAHEKVIKKSCSSFDSKCVGKVCMSRTALPFHVQDMRMWPFFKACKEQHLDKLRGLVGKALITRGSCFCEDVTKLSDEEYPLVHYARMNRLTGCFAIFLHSLESDDDYVLEFFLPRDIKDSWQVRQLVQTLKQNVPLSSGFELGDTSSILTDLYANVYSDVSQTFSDCIDDNSMNIMYTSDSESMDSSATKTVTATIRFADETQIVQLPMSSRLSDLKIQVAHIFELEGEIRLKYMDEENDEILIAVDDDLKSALGTADSYNSINLICQAPGSSS